MHAPVRINPTEWSKMEKKFNNYNIRHLTDNHRIGSHAYAYKSTHINSITENTKPK